jgi:hypothetical protein
MITYPARYDLTDTLISLAVQLAERRAIARAAISAVAGVRIPGDILRAVASHAARSTALKTGEGA